MKSLRSSGDVDRGAHRAQVVEAAAEPALLGEHADRGRTAAGVARAPASAGSGMSARSPLLGLRRLTSAITLEPAAAEVRHRVARRRSTSAERGAQVGGAGVGLASAGEVDPHAGDDVVEHGHGSGSLSGPELVEAHLGHHGEHDERRDADGAADPEQRSC